MSTSLSPEPGSAPRASLVLVHGEGPQPPQVALETLWLQALSHGLLRDQEITLDGVDVRFVYHADLTQPLREGGPVYDAELDLTDARNALQALMALKSAKKFKRSHYESVPGQTPLPEFLADVGAPLSRLLGLGGRRIARHMPELAGYWESAAVRAPLCQRIRDVLGQVLSGGGPVLLIAHGAGTVYAYDALLEFDPTELTGHRIHTWITLGTPLSDDYVRSQVTGSAPRPYPEVLLNWHNLSAEDDAVCHDETVADDFAPMLERHLISRIKDHHIYNLSERYGKSDPHDALGYLIHPRTSQLVGDWLREVAGIVTPAP